jgi:hypothetical protein
MSAEAVMIWRLAPAPDYTGPCHICGRTSTPYDEMAWTTDQESLHHHVEDDEALLRLYTAEARRQARGDWRVYQRLHACHCCMVDYNTQALANDKVHDPSTLRALFQGVGMTGRCAIMWMLYDPQDHTKQQPMLGSGPVGASLHACRAALIHTMRSTPSVR